MLPFNQDKFESELINFNNTWPESRVRSMTIDEYSNLRNMDSFCYWLEYGTKHCGEIGGIALHKFELWKPRDHKDFKNDKFIQDEAYAWNPKKGETSHEAFKEIKSLVLQIISASKKRDWPAIELIPFHSIGKWKIAFLYSNKQLFPVYSERALIAISEGLGKVFPKYTRVVTLQSFIMDQRKETDSTYSFYHHVYSKYALKPNYYIFGSKYGDDKGGDTVPMIDLFIQNQCVAIGFIDWGDFSECMYAEKESVNEFIQTHWIEKKPTLYKMQSYFRKLSQIKEGDIIAVKSHGRYNGLTIIAYAQVVERSGRVYEFDPGGLGHKIQVEFLDAGFTKKTGLTYSETIHEIKPNNKDFAKIFGWFSSKGMDVSIENEAISSTDENAEEEESFYTKRDENPYERSPIATSLVRRIHNEIQNRFVDYLYATYPGHTVRGEKKRIDVQRETKTHLYIYEIKPSASVYACIREGIGQLLDYHHRHPTTKEKHILIVGQSDPEPKDLEFIHNIQRNLQIPFKYLAFDKNTLMISEY